MTSTTEVEGGLVDRSVEPDRKGRRRRVWRLLSWLLAFVLVAPLVPYGVAALGPSNNPNQGAELWRTIRHTQQSGVMRTQVDGVDSSVLINAPGETWRQFRMEQLVPIGAAVLGGTVGVILLFYLLRGRIRIRNGRSGRVVERFDVAQRMVHWFIAILFVLLGVTGLVLLYGRFVLIPLLGPEGFSATASACKEAHNLFGPLFPFAVLAVFVYYLKGNAPRWRDLKWLVKFGGLMSKHGHVPAGRYNAGQKLWFWSIVVLGLVISVSGYVLDFPVFGQSRQIMELAHVSHGVVAILFIAASLGHMYIGSLGMEGALEAMTTGEVDVNWAWEHHEIWLAEAEKAGAIRPASVENAAVKPTAEAG